MSKPRHNFNNKSSRKASERFHKLREKQEREPKEWKRRQREMVNDNMQYKLLDVFNKLVGKEVRGYMAWSTFHG